MPLHELHTFTDAEVATLPLERGVYVLFQIENPVYAGGADNLRQAVADAKGRSPAATHFSTEVIEGTLRTVTHRLSDVRRELKLVGKDVFVGSSRNR
jgi:hypothetical protein